MKKLIKIIALVIILMSPIGFICCSQPVDKELVAQNTVRRFLDSKGVAGFEELQWGKVDTIFSEIEDKIQYEYKMDQVRNAIRINEDKIEFIKDTMKSYDGYYYYPEELDILIDSVFEQKGRLMDIHLTYPSKTRRPNAICISLIYQYNGKVNNTFFMLDSTLNNVRYATTHTDNIIDF